MNMYQPDTRIADRYEVASRPLMGGMGIVYLCYDHKWHEPVALKTFKADLWDESAIEGFLDEAHTWVNLDRHPNVVWAKRVELVGGLPYLVLELITGPPDLGPSLADWLKRDRLSLPLALNFAVQFCIGMNYIHNKLGILHRDIKPENTLVTRDNVLKITDFGLAATLTEARRVREWAGTLPYMSPEQLRREPLDIRSDVYGFGAMLYEMLTGRWPFTGRTGQQIMDGHLYGQAQDPRELAPAVDKPLADLVLRCLAKRPADRPADFAELRDILNDLLEARTGERLPVTFSLTVLKATDWHNKGVSLSYIGRHQEAFTALERALELQPENAETWNSQGVILREMGGLDEALIAFDQAITLNPQHREAWNNKGVCLKDLGRFEEAITCLDQALTIDPMYDHPWINKSSVLLDQGKYEKAIACCDQALALNPSAQAWSNKGVCLRRLGRLEEAIQCQEKALEIEPRNARTWLDKGAVLTDAGQYEEALDCFDRALQIKPEYVLAWTNKGGLLMQLGRLEEGAACFEAALRLDPSHPVAHRQLDAYRQAQSLADWMKRGVDLSTAGDYQGAIAYFDRVLEVVPTHAEAWLNKGVALGQSGQLIKAIGCFDRAIEHDPQDDEAWRNKAFALQSLNLIEKALACYEEALKRNPRSDAALVGKGSILTQMGHLQTALAYFEQACVINPNNVHAQKNRQMAELMLGLSKR